MTRFPLRIRRTEDPIRAQALLETVFILVAFAVGLWLASPGVCALQDYLTRPDLPVPEETGVGGLSGAQAQGIR